MIAVAKMKTRGKNHRQTRSMIPAASSDTGFYLTKMMILENKACFLQEVDV
jgi:hypothetical protein